MTTNHIDQLAQWWDEAEQITNTNLPCAGDALIFPYNAGGYAVEAEEDDWTPDDVVPGEPVRILSRAPKPAWHNAVATIAHIGGNELPRVLVARIDGAFVDGMTGHAYAADRLRDVTPLIEAKVTDEMILAALNASTGLDMLTVTSFKRDEIEDMRLALSAALGLETA